MNYYISPKHQIESNEDGDFTMSDLAIALAHVAGWQLHEKTPLDDAIMVRTNQKGERETVFIPSTNNQDEIERHAKTYGLNPLMPFMSAHFAQDLMTNFPCVITPVISQGGALHGLWKVESLSGWRAADMQYSGVRFGVDEYVESVSVSLPEAIGLNVLNRIGIGKRAYFYYPEMNTENGDLIFMGERARQAIERDSLFMLHIVPAPELDAYAMISAPEEVINEARVLADAQAIIQKTELKRLLDERTAKEEEEAKANGEKQPETSAPVQEDEAVSPAEPELPEQPTQAEDTEQVEEPTPAEPEAK